MLDTSNDPDLGQSESQLGRLLADVELFGAQVETRQSHDFSALLREVELYTEQARESRMRGLQAEQADAEREARDLLELAECTGGIEGFERWIDRPCPRCGARSGAACVRLDTGEELKTRHRERAGLRELNARAVWKARRANGYSNRFERQRSCGGEMVAAHCRACDDRRKAMPAGCDQRMCPSCAKRRARERQLAFGRARGRVILEASSNVKGRGPLTGAAARYRRGGRYTDKMLTLTIPHVDGPVLWRKALDIANTSPEDERAADAIRKLLERGSSTVIMRVSALFLAWPIFWRLLRAALKKRGRHDHVHVKVDRFFEWTEGGDGLGHPHFHCWLWSPWICDDEVRELWTRALQSIGVPMRTREHACENCKKLGRVTPRKRHAFDVVQRTEKPCVHVVGAHAWLQRMYDMNPRAVRELMKSGAKGAIQLAAFRVRRDGGRAPEWSDGSGGRAVHEYAGGWSLAEILACVPAHVAGDLELALEGRRLAQGSAGLYADEGPPPCPCCGRVGTRSILKWSSADTTRTEAWNHGLAKVRERAPPDERRTA